MQIGFETETDKNKWRGDSREEQEDARRKKKRSKCLQKAPKKRPRIAFEDTGQHYVWRLDETFLEVLQRAKWFATKKK